MPHELTNMIEAKAAERAGAAAKLASLQRGQSDPEVELRRLKGSGRKDKRVDCEQMCRSHNTTQLDTTRHAVPDSRIYPPSTRVVQ